MRHVLSLIIGAFILSAGLQAQAGDVGTRLHVLSKLPSAERNALTPLNQEQLAAVEGGDFTRLQFCALIGVSSCEAGGGPASPAVLSYAFACQALGGVPNPDACIGGNLPANSGSGSTTTNIALTVTCKHCVVIQNVNNQNVNNKFINQGVNNHSAHALLQFVGRHGG